jgi:CYTH domain-containing protein
MATEIERKYLVLNDSWRDHASKGAAICQGYLLAKKTRFVRVRIVDTARAVVTVKIRTGRLRREEFEYEVPYADGLEMIAFGTGVVTWEVDVYNGVNDGLVLAATNFPTKARNFPARRGSARK